MRAGRALVSRLLGSWDYLLLLPLCLPYLARGLGEGTELSLDRTRDLREILLVLSGHISGQGAPAMGGAFGNLLPLHSYISAVPLALGADTETFSLIDAFFPYLGVVACYALTRQLGARFYGILAVAWMLPYPRSAVSGQHESLVVASVALTAIAVLAFERRGRLVAACGAWLGAMATFAFQAFGVVPLLTLALVRLPSRRSVPWRGVPFVMAAACAPLLPTFAFGRQLPRYYELLPLFLVVVALLSRGRRAWQGRERTGFLVATVVAVVAYLGVHLTHPTLLPHVAGLGPLFLPTSLGSVSEGYGHPPVPEIALMFLTAAPLALLGLDRAFARRGQTTGARFLLTFALISAAITVPVYAVTVTPRHLMQALPGFVAVLAVGLREIPRLWAQVAPGLRIAAMALVIPFPASYSLLAEKLPYYLDQLRPEVPPPANRLLYTKLVIDELSEATGYAPPQLLPAVHGAIPGWGALARLGSASEFVIALEANAWRSASAPQLQYYLSPSRPPEPATPLELPELPEAYLVPFEPSIGSWHFLQPDCSLSPIDWNRGAVYPPFTMRGLGSWRGAIAALIPSVPRVCDESELVAYARRQRPPEPEQSLLVALLTPNHDGLPVEGFTLYVDGVEQTPVRVDARVLWDSHEVGYPWQLVYDLADAPADAALEIRYSSYLWASVDIHDAYRSFLDASFRDSEDPESYPEGVNRLAY